MRATTDAITEIKATFETAGMAIGRREKKPPKATKRGYPGGCATPLTNEAVTRSPISPL